MSAKSWLPREEDIQLMSMLVKSWVCAACFISSYRKKEVQMQDEHNFVYRYKLVDFMKEKVATQLEQRNA